MEIAAVLSIVGLIIGAIAGFFSGKAGSKKAVAEAMAQAESDAKELLDKATLDAEAKAKERLDKANNTARKIRSEADRDANQKRKKAEAFERELRTKENKINQRSNSLKTREEEVNRLKASTNKEQKEITQLKQDLSGQRDSLKKRLADADRQKKKVVTELQKQLEMVAGMSREDAKEQLVKSMVEQAETDAMASIKDIVEDAKLKANREAKKIIIQTIQRTAAEHTIENTVSVFNLESDDVKGQIIGREGRNIRALEAATGVEIIVDDTPEAIVISGYDPVRREIARLSLQRLVTDGRIHPARIEEVVAKTRKQIEQQIVEFGERTVIDLNIHGMHPQLVKIVGRMRYRSSYGQNLLQHSIETAKVCAIMCAELGLKPKTIQLAKRAGLLHDIGKVPHEETDLSHALLGMKWAEKYKEHKAVCNAIGAHHDEVEMTHLISPIVQACDAISGARPGARREILESYLKRIKELEELAANFPGVEKAYAIQAGRELRVMVRSEEVPDDKADELSLLISTKIQNEMQYPGQVKVTVIREKRAITYAR